MIQITNLASALIIVCLLSACGKGGNNPFEEAFNPFTGTKEKAFKFRDEVGLEKSHNFYGVEVSDFKSTFQTTGMLEHLAITVDYGTTPAAMRNALAKACQSDSAEFVINPNYPRGSIRKFPNGNSPALGVTYDLACIYEGDTRRMHIYSSLKSPNQK
jgi:hypothetical protein